MRLSVALLALCVLCPAAPLSAQTPPRPPSLSVTISPLHLLNPQVHVTGERRIGPRLSVAATLGAGRVSDEGETFRILEVGGQVRTYLLGSFAHGVMVGADVGYVDVNGRPASALEMLVGTRAGAVLGYKTILKRGFTGEVQLGPVYVWGDAGSEWQTVANLKLGWSF